jgi:regulator of CtrA degradation
VNRPNTINLAERFATSGRFKTLFREGMALVEETATYLDGDGRDAAKMLSRQSAMLYGAESMRLTTRLMQLASWLLLQRAVTDGEMTRQQLLDEKRKIHLESMANTSPQADWSMLPEPFVELVIRSIALQKRISVLDHEIYGNGGRQSDHHYGSAVNPVDQQLNLLSTALGAKIKQ